MNILFLYTEISTYFLACVNKLAEDEFIKVHIIRWPLNKEAPFDFKFDSKLNIYNKSEYTYEQLSETVSTIKPDFIYCAGWVDKDYLKICRSFKKSIPLVVGCDNPWTGNIKQHLAAFIARFTIRSIFNYCLVPGDPQVPYVRRMGFDNEHILKGLYSADVDLFSEFYTRSKSNKIKNFPHRFIYSGRYVPYKWIEELTEIFEEAKLETRSDWELWCIGTGPVKPLAREGVRHLGFVQPDSLESILSQTGVFILPSLFEPWGVVVHEFAAAGFPLICSDAVGAASAFLKNNENGFIYKSGDRHQLKHILKKVMKMSEQELLKFGEKSHLLAQAISPAKWADQVKQLTSGK